MATKTVKVRLMLRTQTAAEWASKNPVLLKGEAGIESDTRHWKTGDGTSAWNDLPYRSEGLEVGTAAPADVTGIPGTLYYDQTGGKLYALVRKSSGNAWEQIVKSSDLANLSVASAGKLSTPRTISVSGDASASGSFDGSQDLALSLTLSSILTAQNDVKLPKISVDAKGRITSISSMAAADVRTLLELGSAALKTAGNAAGNVPLIGSDGKLDTSVMPQLTITDTFEAASKSAMLALEAQQGDVCLRSDESKTYILAGSDPTVESNWKLFLSPGSDVLSVNGKTGVVTVNSDDVSEGSTNLYWTQTRFDNAFAAKSTDDLSEGSTNLYYTEARGKSAAEAYLTDAQNEFILDGNV